MHATASAPRVGIRTRSIWLLAGGVFVLCAAVAKLTIHLYASHFYGYFTDELYYLACARHLAWGYVDQPPLIALITRLGVALWGDSLAAIRFFPALAGAGKIILTGLIARELGGKRFAQGLAALSVLLAPGFLGMDNLLSMNVFERFSGWVAPMFICASSTLETRNCGCGLECWLDSACSTNTPC